MNILDRAIGALLLAIADGIRLLGVRPLDDLVWMRSGPPLGTFWDHEWSALLGWYGLFAAVAVTPGLVQLIVMYWGLRTAIAGGDRRVRAQLYQLFPGFVALVVMVAMAPLLLRQLLGLNAWLTQLVGARLGEARQYFGDIRQLNPDQVSSYALYGLMHLVLVGLELVTNFLYVIRKVVIAASFVLLPLAGWVFVFRHTYTPLLLLVSEIVSNAFMHASHAITIAVLVAVVVRPESQTPWWILIMAPTLLPVVSAYLRRLLTGYLNFLGVNEEKWAGLAAVGVGSMVALGKAGSALLSAAGGSTAARALGRTLAGTAGRVPFAFVPGGGDGGGGGGGSGSGPAALLTPATGVVPTLGSLLGSRASPGQGGGGGGGLVNIPLNTGGGAAPGVTVRGIPVVGKPTSTGGLASPAWTQNLRSGGNAVQLGGSGAPQPQAVVPDLPMGRHSSGLYVPVDAVTASQPGTSSGGTGGSIAAPGTGASGRSGPAPASEGASGSVPVSGQVAGPEPDQPGGQPGGSTGAGSAAVATLSALGRAGVRAAEVGFKGSVTVAAAMVGAGLAAVGGSGMVQTTMEVGREVANAVWSVPGRVASGARDLYARLKSSYTGTVPVTPGGGPGSGPGSTGAGSSAAPAAVPLTPKPGVVTEKSVP